DYKSFIANPKIAPTWSRSRAYTSSSLGLTSSYSKLNKETGELIFASLVNSTNNHTLSKYDPRTGQTVSLQNHFTLYGYSIAFTVLEDGRTLFYNSVNSGIGKGWFIVEDWNK